MNQTAQIAEPPSLAEPLSSQPLSLAETLRIMDVASALRREREQATQALDTDEVKAQLRKRLLAAAEVTGEAVTPEEIDAAIGHYYDNLHEFREPPRNFSWYIAQAYVRRSWLGAGLGLGMAAAAVGVAAWMLLF